MTFNSATFKVKTRISIPELSAVATAPASHYAFVLAGEKPQLTVVNLKSKEITPFQDPEFAFLGGQFFAVTADGKHVFVGDRGMAHLTVDDGDLSFIQKSPWIASNPGGIFTSPDSKYVALPSGGGNDGVAGMPRTGYGTYLFNASDLDAGIRRVESGAYPRSIGWDAGGKWIFAHDFDHQLKVYDQETLSLRVELILSQQGNDSLRFTSHPQGQGRLLVTIVGAKPQKSGPARLFFIELD